VTLYLYYDNKKYSISFQMIPPVSILTFSLHFILIIYFLKFKPLIILMILTALYEAYYVLLVLFTYLFFIRNFLALRAFLSAFGGTHQIFYEVSVCHNQQTKIFYFMSFMIDLLNQRSKHLDQRKVDCMVKMAKQDFSACAEINSFIFSVNDWV
jgi:hypothetical protein